MRLRELSLPLAVTHPEFLGVVRHWDDIFDHASLKSINEGYFLQMRFFDTSGTEYTVNSVVRLPRNWIASLLSRGEKIDMSIAIAATHSVQELKALFVAFLEDHPNWWIDNEEAWDARHIAIGFGSGRDCQEVVERLRWFAREVN